MLRAPEIRRLSSGALIATALLTGCKGPCPPHGGAHPGAVEIQPDRMLAGEPGTFTVRYTVEESPLPTGSRIIVDWPKAWMSRLYPWSKAVQMRNPSAAHYVAARASRPGVELTIDMRRINLEGTHERYPHIAELTLKRGVLLPGDSVEMSLERTTAPFITSVSPIRVAVAVPGRQPHLLSDIAEYTVESGAPTHYALTVPSRVVAGREELLALTAFDRFGNVVGSALPEPIELSGLRGEVTSAAGGLGPGQRLFRWVPELGGHRGFQWPKASLGGGRVVSGNPARVVAAAEGPLLVWGDLQIHSAYSKDAIGTGALRFARDAARLDFAASTEHADDDAPTGAKVDGLTQREWREIRAEVQALDEPGTFAAILGYECTIETGHHCVYLSGLDGDPIGVHRAYSVEKLWEKLDPFNSLTVPHHLGRRTLTDHLSLEDKTAVLRRPPLPQGEYGGPMVEWKRMSPRRVRPALEIFSSHGSSELYAPEDPLSYENVRYVPSTSSPGGHYARDAWQRGHRIGTVAGSDNHSARPGLPHTGLTAALVEDLSRESVLAAIRGRRTYATTGERIWLEFELGGVRMGSLSRLPGDAEGRLLAAALRPIAEAQVWCHSQQAGRWLAVAEWQGNAKLLERAFTVEEMGRPAACYARVELAGETWGRPARAWSSPIWLVGAQDDEAD